MSNKRFALFLLIAALVLVLIAVMIWYLPRPKTPVSIDFGNRSGGAIVPAGFFGMGGVGSTVSDAKAVTMFTSINLTGNRIWANLDQIYRNGDTPDYSLFDDQVKRATSDGLDPIIVLSGTPPSLGPSFCDPPSDMNKLADMMTAIVSHIAATKPGLKYEVWNEPDSTATLCNTSDAQNVYLNMYAAAAPKVKEASKGGMVGGPILAAPAKNAGWLTSFLSDNRTAPYVDFVSFHLYLTGQWDVDHGMDWNYMFNRMQDPANGWSYYYRSVEGYVRKGSQPNTATTPIYITEYNVNHQSSGNICCQNDYRFGPLWNTITFLDFFNVVADGAAMPPAKIHYYMSSAKKGRMCVIGVLNDAMDCTPPDGGQGYTQYPQYQAFQLFTAPGYLNLESVSSFILPRPALPDGIVAAVFYTPTADDAVIANATATPYMGVPLHIAHTGFHTGVIAREFTIANGVLLTKPLPLTTAAINQLAAVIDVPAYSTVAVELVTQ